jgi:DNA-binding MarR family transcriptional regulator
MSDPSRLNLVSTLRNDIVALSRRLRQSAGADAETWTSLMVLGAIERAQDVATPTQVAAELELKSSNLAQVLRALEHRGLIRRKPDPVDRRKTRLSLTREGLTLVGDTRAKRTQWLADVMDACLSAEEQDQMMGLMHRLAASAPGRPQTE